MPTKSTPTLKRRRNESPSPPDPIVDLRPPSRPRPSREDGEGDIIEMMLRRIQWNMNTRIKVDFFTEKVLERSSQMIQLFIEARVKELAERRQRLAGLVEQAEDVIRKIDEREDTGGDDCGKENAEDGTEEIENVTQKEGKKHCDDQGR